MRWTEDEAMQLEADLKQARDRIAALENKTYQYVTLTGDTARISLKDAVQHMTEAEATIEALEQENERQRQFAYSMADREKAHLDTLAQDAERLANTGWHSRKCAYALRGDDCTCGRDATLADYHAHQGKSTPAPARILSSEEAHSRPFPMGAFELDDEELDELDAHQGKEADPSAS